MTPIRLVAAEREEGTSLPEGFVFLDVAAPTIEVDLRYFSNRNFVGSRVDGYEVDRCIVTQEAAEALGRVQSELSPLGLRLLVFDAYRPQRAVDHFVRWSRAPEDDSTKADYFPDFGRGELFDLGYIAAKSGHSRGSTVDLTLDAADGSGELDMGGPFDFFGERSGHDYRGATSQQRANRLLLRTLMEKHRFRAYSKEWWHYTLVDEPFPNTYFDFPIR
ncbi:MAG: M15 family metallopeptidase [Planctomycetota bacterium]